MLITNIQHFCLDDGPGIRTVVFLAGCNMRCKWCHNPEAVEASIFSKTVKEASIEKIFQEIQNDVSFYMRSNGGVTFSGGEPLLQKEELKVILDKCKKRKIHTAVETAGNYPFDYLEALLENIDLVIIDCKAFRECVHIKCTGQSNVHVLENIRRLRELDRKMLVRIPIVWNINITSEELERIGEFLGYLNIECVELIPYHKLGIAKYERYGLNYLLKDIPEPTEEQMQLCRDIIKKYQVHLIN